MTVDTIITGGRLVSADRVFEASIAIDDGRIQAVGHEDDLPDAEIRHDASGKLVMPGLVDPHVHIDPESPGRIDTYESASRAAAMGGITTMVDFAWQERFRSTDPGLTGGIDYKRRLGEAESLVDFSVHSGITNEDLDVIDELPGAIDRGVTSFKMFMSTYEIGTSNGFIDQVIRAVADLDAVVMLHTEDPSVCEYLENRFVAEGRTDPSWFPKSRPDYAEAMAAEDAVRMAVEAGAKYYGVHTSCAKSADVISQFQEDGSRVRAETCTQYTVLDDSIFDEVGNLAKFAPPLRSPADAEALFDHLRRGSLSVVSTDHAAYERSTKESVAWWESPFGISGLQTSLALFHTEAVVNRGFSYPFLVRVMSTNPARTFGMPGKGSLAPGTDADVVIFDPTAEYTIRTEDDVSRTDYCIYDGRAVTGRVEKTFVRGEPVVVDGEFTAAPGHGAFVERELPDWRP